MIVAVPQTTIKAKEDVKIPEKAEFSFGHAKD